MVFLSSSRVIFYSYYIPDLSFIAITTFTFRYVMERVQLRVKYKSIADLMGNGVVYFTLHFLLWSIE